jgi:lauroyl/myristoyl acyltransferase
VLLSDPCRQPPIRVTAASNPSAPRVHPTSATSRKALQSIELHPVILRTLTSEACAVVRVDGRGAIRTSPLGAEAVRLLRRDASVAAVRARLEARHGAEIDLEPLLAMLVRSGIARRSDGRMVGASAPLRVLDVFRTWWRCYVDLPTRAPHWLLSRLRPALALPLARALSRRRLRHARIGREWETLSARMPHPVAPDQLPALARRHLAELADTDTMARLICYARPEAFGPWLAECVELTGVEHIQRAREAGRGVILAFLHAGAFPLFSVKLPSMGIPFHSFNFGVHFSYRPFDEVSHGHADACGWPRSRFYFRATPSNLASYVRAVRGGEVGVVMPDYLDPGTDRAAAARVRIGEREVLVGAFAGWLARKTRAVIIPCDTTRTARGYRLALHPPVDLAIDPAAPDADADATRQIFARLAPEIERSPESWSFLLTHTPADADVPAAAAAA